MNKIGIIGTAMMLMCMSFAMAGTPIVMTGTGSGNLAVTYNNPVYTDVTSIGSASFDLTTSYDPNSVVRAFSISSYGRDFTFSSTINTPNAILSTNFNSIGSMNFNQNVNMVGSTLTESQTFSGVGQLNYNKGIDINPMPSKTWTRFNIGDTAGLNNVGLTQAHLRFSEPLVFNNHFAASNNVFTHSFG